MPIVIKNLFLFSVEVPCSELEFRKILSYLVVDTTIRKRPLWLKVSMNIFSVRPDKYNIVFKNPHTTYQLLLCYVCTSTTNTVVMLTGNRSLMITGIKL